MQDVWFVNDLCFHLLKFLRCKALSVEGRSGFTLVVQRTIHSFQGACISVVFINTVRFVFDTILYNFEGFFIITIVYSLMGTKTLF